MRQQQILVKHPLHPFQSKPTAMHMQPAPDMSQHHTAEELPPAYRGYEKVVATVEKSPLMLTANEKVDK